MIKKIILFLFPIIAVLVIFSLLKSTNPTEIVNTKKVPLKFKDNKVQCPQCNMFLVGKKYTAQAITSDNKTHFFDDVGCMILWVEENVKNTSGLIQWVYTLDSKKWIKANEAFYTLDEQTPMKYGFGAYEKNSQKKIVFEKMRLKMLRGENLTNPKIRKQILDSSASSQ